MKRQRVLILSASAGAGHIRAAQAIEKAFKQNEHQFEVYHEDALKYTNIAFRNFYSKAYIEMVNTLPSVLGLIYDYADQPWKDERRRLTIDRMNTRPLVKLLNSLKPDIVVCTHFLPAEIISFLLCKKRLKTKMSVVVTDMDIHAMWLVRHYSNYFVALDETKEHLKVLGFDSRSINVSGIPIDPVFAQSRDKHQMRLKYGLKQDIPTIYMSLGGFGVGKTEEVIDGLTKMKSKAQVLAMCGRNERLLTKLHQINYANRGQNNLNIVPIPYTTEVDQYMAASDIVLGKPGGLTTSEALAKSLVFVIVNPIPGQEERNADHLLEQGAAIKCNNLPTLAYKVDSLINNPQKLAAMQSNAQALAKPHAAQAIVEQVINSRGTPYGIDLEHNCQSRLGKLISHQSLKPNHLKVV